MRLFQLILKYREGAYCLVELSRMHNESCEAFAGTVKVQDGAIIYNPAPGLHMSGMMRFAFEVMVLNLVQATEEFKHSTLTIFNS